MTTIYATSVAEYNTWSKYNSKLYHTVLLPEDKRAIHQAKVQYYLNSIQFNGRDTFGKGIYLIMEIGFENKEGRQPAYYARAIYKVDAEDSFNAENEVIIYLNPLYAYFSIVRSDVSYEELIGAVIKVDRVFTTKGSGS